MDTRGHAARRLRYDRHGLGAAEIEALQIDHVITRLARARGLYDLALGETVLALFDGGRIGELAVAPRDFALERLGVKRRALKEWVRLARGCRDRPVLRRAVAAGLVSPRKAVTVFPVAVGEAEASWTAAAVELSLKDLVGAVRAEGEDVEEESRGRARWMPLLQTGQEVIDTACEAVRMVEGQVLPRYLCIEALCMEWMGGAADRAAVAEKENRGSGGGDGPTPEELKAARAAWRRVVRGVRGKAILKQLAALEDATSVVDRMERCRETIAAGDPLALQAQAQRLLRGRQGSDAVFGMLLERIQRKDLWRVLGLPSFEAYCADRLSISGRSARDRVWLERRLRWLPQLRAALKAGKVTYSKALVIARVATPHDIDEWIAKAGATTHQQTEREVRKKEKQKEQTARQICVWGPEDVMDLIDEAVEDMQRWAAAEARKAHKTKKAGASEEFEAADEDGGPIDPGKALAMIAQHYIQVWWPWIREQRKGTDAERYGILVRHGGLCAAPGCSCRPAHVHHVVFRSRCGGEEVWNKVALCRFHHLRCVHKGTMRVEGRAGEHLRWEWQASADGGEEVWITLGADDVLREGAVPRPAAHGADAAADTGAAEAEG